MRIFSGKSEDIPEVKFHLFRHKSYMSACELSSYKSSWRLQDGRVLIITSIDNIDNIVVKEKREKIPLEDFVLPRELKGHVLIWTGKSDTTHFPLSIYSALERFWGSKINNNPVLPSNLNKYSMVFIASLTDPMTVGEMAELWQWKNERNGKIIIHTGTITQPRIWAPYNIDSNEQNIVDNTNDFLDYFSSPMRCDVKWKYLIDYLEEASFTERFTDYDNIVDYMALATNGVRLNSIVGNFVMDSGCYSVTIDPSFNGTLLKGYIRDETSSYYNVPLLYSGVDWMVSRDLWNFPIHNNHAIKALPESPRDYLFLDGSLWGSASIDMFDRLRAVWSPVNPLYGWIIEPTMAHADNIILSTGGRFWFNPSYIFNNSYCNIEFILTLLLQDWVFTSELFKTTLPFIHYYSYDYQVTPFQI